VAGVAEKRGFGLGHELGGAEGDKTADGASQNGQQHQNLPVELFKETHRFAASSKRVVAGGLAFAMAPMGRAPYRQKKPTMNLGPQKMGA
jgi:hypothetical protein